VYGGWLGDRGSLDFAGGTAIHVNAGIASLAAVFVLGKRKGWPHEGHPPHSMPLVMIGTGILWFGWFGFNAGSALASNGQTAQAFMNTFLAAAGAGLAWVVVEWIRDGHPTNLGAASGIVAGLVAITPSCGAVNVYGALAVGVVAGVLCALAVNVKFKLGLDDSLDVVGVHLVGGIVGALMIGLVGPIDGSPTGKDGFFPSDGLFYGGGLTLFGHQAAGVLFTIVWCGVFTVILGLLIKVTIGWRVTEENENIGIDMSEHGETAYDLVGSGGHL
jgi:Amt family ammonium transporter